MANFFDNLKDSISKGAATVNQKANDLMETNKINQDIKAAQQQKDADIVKLGQLLYNFKKNPDGVEPDYDAVIADMDSIDAKIDSLKKQLQDLRNEQVCPNCGSSVPKGTAFCPNCGSKMPVPEVKPVNPCPSCGKENTPGDKFCQYCGTPLNQEAPAVETAPVVEAAPTEDPVAGEIPAEAPVHMCPQCGTPYNEGDKFCQNCGQTL